MMIMNSIAIKNLWEVKDLGKCQVISKLYIWIILKELGNFMTPIFKCLICRRDIERSTKSFWIKKGHLLCSSCLDDMEINKHKKAWQLKPGVKI